MSRLGAAWRLAPPSLARARFIGQSFAYWSPRTFPIGPSCQGFLRSLLNARFLRLRIELLGLATDFRAIHGQVDGERLFHERRAVRSAASDCRFCRRCDFCDRACVAARRSNISRPLFATRHRAPGSATSFLQIACVRFGFAEVRVGSGSGRSRCRSPKLRRPPPAKKTQEPSSHTSQKNTTGADRAVCPPTKNFRILF